MIQDILITILSFTRNHIIWSFPTNPITGVMYVAFSFYGYTKLKPHVNISKKPNINKILSLLYAVCLLAFMNFILENIWLTFFFIRFHYFNGGGWLEHIYFVEGMWVVNYLRNFGCLLIFYILSKDVWSQVNFTKKTLYGILAMTVFLFLYFFVSSSYVIVDWSYGLAYNYGNDEIVKGFLLSLTGKPILFYIYSTIFRKEKELFE